LYYTSYAQPREFVWLVGVIILLIMILTAFIGYVLPWGQMSLWGRTVITSLASALPVVGTSIVGWLWGGFCVDNPTLNRFFSFHYLFPFLLSRLSLVHLAALHQYGSTNPLGINAQRDLVNFYPYFYTKDLVAALALSFGAAYLVNFNPELLGHPDNNIPANPYSTPAHIVPEWYFCAPMCCHLRWQVVLPGIVVFFLVYRMCRKTLTR
jgi:ubiquinol-cytochrome c reductase cytochrome b subunit